MNVPILQARHLTRSIRGRAVVRDVSFELHPGENLGLIGPNGSGKSSLLRLLAGLQRPDSGEVMLKGDRLSRLPRRQIARTLAFVAQSQEASERLTVRQSVALGRTPWLTVLSPWGPADEAAVQKALSAVGLQGFEGRDWESLSGGERQRAHIARALAQEPELMILDEPSNHLDIHHQMAVLDLIAGLDVTTILAVHDLNHAMRCDRIVCLLQGQLVALGTPQDVLTPQLLREVFQIHARQLTDPRDGQLIWRFDSLEKV
ncbi:ABC transporter ATP-binding protein [Falsigemmobacter faecalis]|uniref:ABC transporter ATP-binding protein n=1 Tax=Falsigemmobacter faecalis TaxID=2488730 RepID=A0A3P3DEW6_9RHOB|nr:ABC transporter ATP-binding protein [Falsigemmobacter faecalis]RRH72042.1 ABC transporter ATP-binding protein [Falsigemmobacter faecalis]